MADKVGRSPLRGSGLRPDGLSQSSLSQAKPLVPNASDYAVLKAYGHSPAKAAEIVLDAKRGDFFCERYVAFVRGSVAL